MEAWQHDAYHAVRETLTRYTWCGDFGDEAGFLSNFTRDATLEIKGDRVLEGHDGIRQLFAPGGPSDPKASTGGPLRHHVSSIRIEIESATRARAWSYFINLGPHGLDHWGRYADELVPDEMAGRWLFHRRRVSIDGASADSVAFPGGALPSR